MQFFGEGNNLCCTVEDFLFVQKMADENQVNDTIQFIQAVNEKLAPQDTDIQKLVFTSYLNDSGEYSVMASNGEINLVYSVGEKKTVRNICIYLETVFSAVTKIYSNQK